MPQSRIEAILENILGADNPILDPMSRNEVLLIRIMDMLKGYGLPPAVSEVAQMTDPNQIYVYTGSESGYTAGNWYYYNGTAWTSGGAYDPAPVTTDPTLSIPDRPADAKATGEAVTDLKSATNNIEDVIYPNQDAVFSQYSGDLSAVNQYIQIGTLKQGNAYRFVLSFSGDPIRLAAIRTSTSSSSSGNVDTITDQFTGDSWTLGKTCIYTPLVDGITRLQIQFNSSYTGDLSTDLTVYDYTKETTTAIAELEVALSETQGQVDGLKYIINLEDAYNLLPPTGYEVGKYISTNGTITEHATLVLSDYIEIDPAKGYICNWAKTATIVNDDASLTGTINTFDRLQFCFFDEDKNVIPFSGSTSTASKAIPQNAKYIRVTILNETVYPYARLIYGNYESQPIVRICDYHKTYPDIYAEANTGLESFNMVMFGDSITHGSLSVNDGGTSYVDYANDYLHSNIINVGFGGTRMTYTLSDAGLFCFYHLCECITSDDPTAWDDLDYYAEHSNTTYLPHLQTLKAIDWTKIHAVGLMYGANDYTSNTPVGSGYNETVTNFDGACAYGLKLLLTKYPHLQVLILSPFDREMAVGDASTMTDRLANSAGLIMSDYGDSLENVVSRIHCALIRTDKLFGINQYTVLDYALDGTHPRSNMAQKRLGWLFAQAVKNNLAPFNG